MVIGGVGYFIAIAAIFYPLPTGLPDGNNHAGQARTGGQQYRRSPAKSSLPALHLLFFHVRCGYCANHPPVGLQEPGASCHLCQNKLQNNPRNRILRGYPSGQCFHLFSLPGKRLFFELFHAYPDVTSSKEFFKCYCNRTEDNRV